MLGGSAVAGLGFAAVAAAWAPPPVGPLWSPGAGAVIVSACTPGAEHDASCRALEVRDGSRRQRLGEGYITVRRLWSRPPGAAGPDVLVLGDPGGSAGAADVFAVSFAPLLSIRRLGLAHLPQADVIAAAAAPLSR